MSYRDWGRGESSPHAREPIASWDEALAPAPADPYLPDQSPSTPSRRQACDRQQDEPVDAYLPRWAIDSGIRRPDGGGRHAAPDDDGDGAARPNFDGAWRTGRAGSRRRAYEIDWRDAPSPESEHTAEWTFDRPQEQGYVGSRRADPADDGSFPGAIAARRPRRSPAGRPQVSWSGGEEFSTRDPTEHRERDRPGRRTRRAAKGEPRPAVDTWDRTARRGEEAEPALQPAVDPWDASGVQVVPAAEVDPWDASGVHVWPAVGGDRGHGTGRWAQPDHTGEWERYADVDRWDRTESPRSPLAVEGPESPGWSGRDEGFRPGTGPTGEDPRWMDPATSAPRSPAVTYSAPRPRSRPGAYGPSRRRTDPIGAPRGTGRTPPRRRVDTVASNDWTRRIETTCSTRIGAERSDRCSTPRRAT
ncbi:hypothetical protein [Micromonospora sp. NPDC005367]|uniref:hypothetical protein n=1 Tax=Micromonospora sp. NPDC005367 TaxID=3155590 RepID=UPI0033A59045